MKQIIQAIDAAFNMQPESEYISATFRPQLSLMGDYLTRARELAVNIGILAGQFADPSLGVGAHEPVPDAPVEAPEVGTRQEAAVANRGADPAGVEEITVPDNPVEAAPAVTVPLGGPPMPLAPPVVEVPIEAAPSAPVVATPGEAAAAATAEAIAAHPEPPVDAPAGAPPLEVPPAQG